MTQLRIQAAQSQENGQGQSERYPWRPSTARTSIMDKLSDEQRKAALDTAEDGRHRISQACPGQRAEEPDSFDDFDQHTLVALAHVEHRDNGY